MASNGNGPVAVEGGILMPERVVPHPNSVSPQARAFLAQMTQYMAAGRPVYPPLDDADAWRKLRAERDAMMNAMSQGFFGESAGNPTETIQIAGVTVHTSNPPGAVRDDYIYLDIHGGGLIFGAGEFCRAGAAASAVRYGARCYAPDYRVPPEHPFPAALDDCLAVYADLVARFDPKKIVVGGASAGGNLSAALMLRARDEGLPLPAGLVLLTPELDLTESGDSFGVNKFADVVLVEGLPEVNALYAGGHNLAHPYLSPLFGDFRKGFPPTLLQAGTRDVFLSNVARMHTSLRRAGVPVEILLCEAMPHGGFAGCPEDQEMYGEIRDFVWRCWGR